MPPAPRLRVRGSRSGKGRVICVWLTEQARQTERLHISSHAFDGLACCRGDFCEAQTAPVGQQINDVPP